MSDDNKNLSDDLNDMIGDAKENTKKAAEKISQKASELADEAKEFAGEAKEKASEFANDAKVAGSEFASEAKQVLSDGKNVAIIAHLWWIGWIIALVMKNSNKTELGSFYVRQTLGLLVISLVDYLLYFISPLIGGIIGLLLFVLWIISLVGAFNGKTKPIFLLGDQFQDWFKSL